MYTQRLIIWCFIFRVPLSYSDRLRVVTSCVFRFHATKAPEIKKAKNPSQGDGHLQYDAIPAALKNLSVTSALLQFFLLV